MPRKITTAERFRNERLRAGLSLPELAERAGVDRATVWRIEAGEHETPRMGTVRAIAKALGVKVADLLGEEAA